MARGASRLTKPWQTPNTSTCEHGRHTAGANVRREKEDNPDRQLRSQNYRSVGNDVGRHRQLGGWLRSSHPLKKRNSSLVESACAEDLTGLSGKPKLGVLKHCGVQRGRGAFRTPVKADRKVCWRYRKCEC